MPPIKLIIHVPRKLRPRSRASFYSDLDLHIDRGCPPQAKNVPHQMSQRRGLSPCLHLFGPHLSSGCLKKQSDKKDIPDSVLVNKHIRYG